MKLQWVIVENPYHVPPGLTLPVDLALPYTLLIIQCTDILGFKKQTKHVKHAKHDLYSNDLILSLKNIKHRCVLI